MGDVVIAILLVLVVVLVLAQCSQQLGSDLRAAADSRAAAAHETTVQQENYLAFLASLVVMNGQGQGLPAGTSGAYAGWQISDGAMIVLTLVGIAAAAIILAVRKERER